MASKAKEAVMEKGPAVDNTEQKDQAASSAKSELKSKFRSKFKHPLSKPVLLGLAGLMVAVMGWGAYYAFGGHQKEAAAISLVKRPAYVDMPDMIVNLTKSDGGRTHYLKVKIVLDLPDQMLIQQIQPVMPRLVDTFQMHLRELRPDELDASAGLSRVKQELTRRVNASIAPSRINGVLFKEIVLQ